jgi:hypothetical protein
MQTSQNKLTDEPARDPTIPIVMSVMFAGFATALSLYLIGKLLFQVFDRPAPVCSIDEPCLDGMQCRQGKCVPLAERDRICLPDAPKGTCYCPEPREWVGDRCVRKDPPPTSCDAEAFALLTRLRETQQRCQKQVKGDITSCRTADVRQFLLENGQFHKILNKFPATTWVLFPPSRPRLDRPWPSKTMFEYYMSNLRLGERLLDDAWNILVLSHATDDNDPSNDAFLQERLRFGFRLVQELAAHDAQRWSRLREKFLAFPIPTDQRLTFDDFKAIGEIHIVAWDEDSQIRYSKLLERARKDDLRRNELDELLGVFSRSVTIVPVPCELPPNP